MTNLDHIDKMFLTHLRKIEQNLSNIHDLIEPAKNITPVFDRPKYKSKSKSKSKSESVSSLNSDSVNILSNICIDLLNEHISELYYIINDYKHLISLSEKKDILSKYSKLTKQQYAKLRLLGPQPITLNHEHLNTDSPINIIHGYAVTEKADGYRAMLYITNNRGYLINGPSITNAEQNQTSESKNDETTIDFDSLAKQCIHFKNWSAEARENFINYIALHTSNLSPNNMMIFEKIVKNIAPNFWRYNSDIPLRLNFIIENQMPGDNPPFISYLEQFTKLENIKGGGKIQRGGNRQNEIIAKLKEIIDKLKEKIKEKYTKIP